MVIHAGAISSAEEVQRDPALGWNVNVRATEVLSEWAASTVGGLSSLPPIWFSTARNPGIARATRPFRSWNTAGPSWPPRPPCSRHARGSSSGSACCMARRCGSSQAYFDQAIAGLRSGTPQAFFEDEFRTPLDYVTAARHSDPAGRRRSTGIIHAGGPRAAQPLRADAAGRTALGRTRDWYEPTAERMCPARASARGCFA